MAISSVLGSSALLPAGLGFRNKIINGAMVIDQRKSGAAINPVTSDYTVDRWSYYQSQASKFSFQQNQGAIIPPVGFSSYSGFTSLSAYSVSATDQFLYSQKIEGQSVADLAWGTANAKPIALSFWVRSSLTGTFGGSIQNSAANRCFPFSYTINSANTWEYETVYIVGDSSGTWLTTNGVGVTLNFSLATGSTYSGTAGAWSGSSFITSSTGATSVAGTSGATWQITGVQLEQNTQPTPFEQRPIGVELELCQRYYQRMIDPAGSGVNAGTTTAARVTFSLYTKMRVAPTSTMSGTLNFYNGSSTPTATSINSVFNSVSYGQFDFLIAGTGATGQALVMYTTGGSQYIDFNSEL